MTAVMDYTFLHDFIISTTRRTPSTPTATLSPVYLPLPYSYKRHFVLQQCTSSC